jgi:septal ring factor EnvC (AmiA/AmiB activator)
MEISDVKTALDDFTHAVRDTVTSIKATEAEIAETESKNESKKRALAKVLRATASEVRKILSTSA